LGVATAVGDADWLGSGGVRVGLGVDVVSGGRVEGDSGAGC